MQLRIMKKFLKLLVAIILAIVILGGVMFLIDCSRGKSGNEPIFAVIKNYDNGGKAYYRGLGYTITFDAINGEINAKILGLNEIELQEGKNIIEEPDFDNNNLPSGDIINNEIISGEVISGDVIDNNEITTDEVEVNDVSGEVTSGDNTIDIESVSGDEAEGYYFNATVIGINNRNLVVQALEDEWINASADMFSFSLPEDDSTSYLIGQKVRIKYTGIIRESYPAQIDVISIEMIEQ